MVRATFQLQDVSDISSCCHVDVDSESVGCLLDRTLPLKVQQVILKFAVLYSWIYQMLHLLI